MAQTDIVEFMVLILLSLILWTNVALGQSPESSLATPKPSVSFEQSFQEGIQFYQSKAFEKAQTSFENALQINPNNISLLTNLGMTAFEMGKKGLALGYLRRALEKDADFRPAELAYNHVWSQLEVKELPHRIETYETLRQYFLQPFSLFTYLWFGGLCFLFSGWLLINYFGQRRRAFLDELPLPAFPTVGTSLFTLFIAVFFLTLMKAYDLNLDRATIITEKVALRTAPSDNETSLFELSQGLEVIIRKSDSDWVQVTYPGGPTGWVKKTDLMITTGKGS